MSLQLLFAPKMKLIAPLDRLISEFKYTVRLKCKISLKLIYVFWGGGMFCLFMKMSLTVNTNAHCGIYRSWGSDLHVKVTSEKGRHQKGRQRAYHGIKVLKSIKITIFKLYFVTKCDEADSCLPFCLPFSKNDTF